MTNPGTLLSETMNFTSSKKKNAPKVAVQELLAPVPLVGAEVKKEGRGDWTDGNDVVDPGSTLLYSWGSGGVTSTS